MRRAGMMIRWIAVAMLALLPAHTYAASASDWPMEEFSPDLTNLPSLQNGLKLYANYCLGCHGLQFQRYERTADDLGIPHDVAMETVVFTGQQIGGLMKSAMDPELAKSWFGAPPPDLTMVTRVRNPDWVYNYLKTFYVDESRPFGVNNKVFPNVGMPNVLVGLQGTQRCHYLPKRGRTNEEPSCNYLAVDQGTGAYSKDEFDQAVYDLTNFLYYVSEPSRLERHRTGIFVILFLVLLGACTWLLNREYWKDVH